MATVYFVKELSTIALQLIEEKGSFDKVKAYNDLQQIQFFFSAYGNGCCYNTVLAKELDERLRKEYPVIDRINELPAPFVSGQMKEETSPIDADISQLLQDYWGIQFDVLLKDGIVKKLEDFVDHIE